MKVKHLLYTKKNYGGSETYIKMIRKFSKHHHVIDFAEVPSIVPTTDRHTAFYSDFDEYIKKSDHNSFDVIHPHFFIPGYFAEKRGMRYVCTSHCMLSREFQLAKYDAKSIKEIARLNQAYTFFSDLERQLFPQIKNLFTMGSFHTREIELLGGRPNMATLPTDTELFFDVGKEKSRERLGIDDKFTILFNGRATHLKGLHVLVNAFERIKVGDMQLMLVGDFSKSGNTIYYHPCVGFSNNEIRVVSNNAKNVIVSKAMPVEQMPTYYSAADVIVCPSFYESVGNVNIESMACERPVIASRVAGIPSVVEHGVNGLLFEPGDEYALLECLLEIKSKPYESVEMGRRGRDFVMRTHNIREIINEIDRVYDKTGG